MANSLIATAPLKRKLPMSPQLPMLARRRLKVFFVAIGAALLPALPLGAAEQAITMEGVARSASLMEAIAELCPPYGADGELAGRYVKAFITAGGEAYGKRRFSAALKKARAERREETRSSAPAAWCEEQRQKQQQIGDSGIFPAK